MRTQLFSCLRHLLVVLSLGTAGSRGSKTTCLIHFYTSAVLCVWASLYFLSWGQGSAQVYTPTGRKSPFVLDLPLTSLGETERSLLATGAFPQSSPCALVIGSGSMIYFRSRLSFAFEKDMERVQWKASLQNNLGSGDVETRVG